MKVMKFGGTSVGQPQRMQMVADLITADKEKKIVVLSALSGSTNALSSISNLLATNQRKEAKEQINILEKHYRTFVLALLKEEAIIQQANLIIEEHFEFLSVILKISYSQALNKDILAQGELLSTKLFCLFLEEKKIAHKLLPALDFMTLDQSDEPQIGTIKVKLSQLISKNSPIDIFITQGYITRNARGEVDNLKRGGSDYTASLIAAALQADVCEIWTDIDGMHNNDPRVVSITNPIEQLSFEEAAELAYFGAKILHPSTIWPAQYYNVPVQLLNSLAPQAKGTLITKHAGSTGVKAVAAKDGITAIRIKSSRMLLAYGFLRKVFEVFEKYKTAIDMITTSEVAVSVTIDDDVYLNEIIKELSAFGNIEIDNHQSIISVVGNQIADTKEVLSKLFNCLHQVPVRMVSYGGSRHNVSILVPQQYKNDCLKAINEGLFGLKVVE